MKGFFSLAWILGLSTLGFNAIAQQGQSAQDQAGAAQQQQESVDTQSARSFRGKIAKAGDKLVLRDSATNEFYLLDDQDKAKQFEGKYVKVIATMDSNTNTLHVVDITLAER
jgi:hypothetical protein